MIRTLHARNARIMRMVFYEVIGLEVKEFLSYTSFGHYYKQNFVF